MESNSYYSADYLISTFLCATPSAVAGVASLLDFTGAMLQFNDAATPVEADALAGVVDTLALRGDFDAALRQFAELAAA